MSNRFPLGLDVNWVSPDDFSPVHAHLHDWLLSTGSLTERLESLCSTFEVEVLGQASGQLDRSEKLILQTHEQQNWQVREVLLYGDGVPWVFARSILPISLCEAELANLGNKPLGKRIFNDPEFVRGAFEVGRLLRHPITQLAKDGHAMYARRSKFSIDNEQLLVAEAFLPDCPCYKDV